MLWAGKSDVCKFKFSTMTTFKRNSWDFQIEIFDKRAEVGSISKKDLEATGGVTPCSKINSWVLPLNMTLYGVANRSLENQVGFVLVV